MRKIPVRTSRLAKLFIASCAAILVAPTLALTSETSTGKSLSGKAAPGHAAPDGEKWLSSGQGSWRSGCNHYQNRARFLAREGEIEFVVLLADACSAAERSLESPNAHERSAAELFLQKVVDLRDTLVDLNMRRVYGDAATPMAQPKSADGTSRRGRAIEISHVGKWGEYLIAHRMGLISAYDVWLDSGTDFSIAFKR